MGGASHTMKGLARAVLYEDLAVGEADVSGGYLPHVRGDGGHAFTDLQGGVIHRPGDGAREAARVVAGGYRPGVLAGVQLDIHADAFQLHT